MTRRATAATAVRAATALRRTTAVRGTTAVRAATAVRRAPAVRAATAACLAVAALVAAAPPAPPTARLDQDTEAVHRAGAVGAAAVLDTASGTATAHSGTADTRTGRPMRPDDHYRAGSTLKTFIATVVLQLVGEGRLSLSDPVEKWLPGVVSGNGNDGRRITVRMLLQHTSGVPNVTRLPELLPALYSADGYYRNRFRHYTAEELVAAAMRHPPDFEPGTGYRYSNTGYLIAGMIIEKVTGHGWRTEVRDRLIRPLRLTGTSLPGDTPVLPAPYAHGYHSYAGGGGGPVDTTLFNGTAADAAGDLVTTPHDVNRLFTALLTGRLLRPAELDEMRRTVPMPGEPGRSVGLGLETTPLSCGGFYWHHGGNALGYSSENGVTTDGRRAVTVATNSFDEADEARQDAADRAVKELIDNALCGRPAKP
ncbi:MULTISPECIES: serine hydrolase domain-containing protein [Streptomyces]|uniref:serine hydrolase domain-containing protein n=1 Tax=Streptomyces TaxID=1883 RepID=UPI00099E6DC5|nr:MULTISPECIES: serine hydrolase domain-containing protein [Streptomyces]